MDPRNKHHLKALVIFLLAYYWKASILPDGYGFIVSTVYNLVVVWIVYTYDMSYRQPRVPSAEFDVCVVGAGFSGLAMAVRLKEMGVKFRIIDKAQRLGGTWWENQYPGCTCDVASHCYSYSFAMNPDWSRSYSPQGEIHRYLEHVADKFGIIGKIEFGKKLDKAVWNKKTSKWHLQLESGEEIITNALVSCMGQLHVPREPEFPGREAYTGRTFHSARWSQGYDPAGETVAVVGTGASSVQIVPAITPKVKHLYVFQRTACWTAKKDDIAFPRWLRTLFRVYPPLMYLLRSLYFWRNEFALWAIFREGGILAEKIPKVMTRGIYKQVKDPAVADKLVPKYLLGCKRLVLGHNYAKTFNRDNVTLVTDPIQRLTERGIQTQDGSTYDLDTIVYATGFDILETYKALNAYTSVGVENFKPNTNINNSEPLKSDNLRSLREEWGDTPNAYLGITIPDYPNAFMMVGPSTGLATNSLIFMMECQANYIGECLRAMIEKRLKVLNVTKAVNERYQCWSQETLKNKAYNSSSCTSWWKNSRGINWTLWSTDLVTYWRMTRNVNLRDYNCK